MTDNPYRDPARIRHDFATYPQDKLDWMAMAWDNGYNEGRADPRPPAFDTRSGIYVSGPQGPAVGSGISHG